MSLQRRWDVVALRAAVAWLLLAWCPRAFALNPGLDVSQYAHAAWRVREGFSKGAINAIAQTPDGYLWLGTEFGLLRFDGVRNVAWQPPPGQHLPSNVVSSLLVGRDGTLWIGTFAGLASWDGRMLTQYGDLAGRAVGKLVEDRDGAVWAGGFTSSTATFCAIAKGRVECYGGDGRLGPGVTGLYADSHGRLWVGVMTGVWRWSPGPPEFYSIPGELNGIQGLAEDQDGALLVSVRGGITRLVDGKVEQSDAFPEAVRPFQAVRTLRDRDGGVWIGTVGGGVVHVHQSRADVYAQADGLSHDRVLALYEDREGSVWVATSSGLDRFRETAVVTVSVEQGLSNAVVTSVLAASDGSMWVGTSEGLNRWKNGEVTVYHEHATVSGRGGRPPGNAREITGRGLPEHGVQSLFQDGRGRIWISTHRDVGYLEGDRFTVSAVPGRNTADIVEDTGGNLWFANTNLALFRRSPRGEVLETPWPSLQHNDSASVLLADRARGGLWIGFVHGGLVRVVDGKVVTSYSTGDGLGAGRVTGLRLDQDGTLWAATESGLSRFKGGPAATLSSGNGLPCDAVHWMEEDAAHALWLFMPCGLVRVARSELDAWITAVDADGRATKRTIRSTLFDNADGVKLRALSGGYNPMVTRSPDGRLWFSTADGVSVVDPGRLPFNTVPPPVHIEQITADRKAYDATSIAGGLVSLPALVRDLEIDYTALSLVAPEKNRFRYMLEGWDRDWQDVGNRRQAFYSNLPPRNYRFRVMGSNNSDVWNEAGAFLDFSVAPAYYQTAWFRLSAVAAVLALLAALYRLRLRQVAHQFNMRVDARVSERTRIARDLHDTLLQSFHAVLLRFQAATYLLPDRPAEARETLETAIEQAWGAVAEGRDAVHGLRASTVATKDLAAVMTALGAELAAADPGKTSPDVRVHVEGSARNLAPLLQDDVYRIAGEALRNAFRHADASRVVVEIRFDDRQLRLRVRDDGKGMDQKVVDGDGRNGHYGLPGMRERASLVEGTLTVWSERGAGTEIELTIPGQIAYEQPTSARNT